jgi:uncharacterized protein
MTVPDLFINRAGRLRSFWRLAAFALVYVFVVNAVLLLVQFGLAFVLPRETFRRLLVESVWAYVVQSVVFFGAAALVGWGCGRVLEDLPWRSLGWARHRGWARDLLLGLGLSVAAIVAAFLLGYLFGGYRLALNAPAQESAGAHWLLVAQTFATSGLIFLGGAAAEEMLFRGYPLQTVLRSWPVWVALAPTSVFFALVHLSNPNVAPGFTVANTTLAGVWLAVAYWRTRSLWFPLGLHWGWNWAQGALLGSPVSGITELTPEPLMRFTDAGPSWLGGGAYGIEGGAACTVALLAAILHTWRTRLVSATAELRQYTDEENPNPDAAGPVSVIPRAAGELPRALVHLVHLRSGDMLLSKKDYSGWQEIQDEHEDYMTSLGPFDEEGLLEYLSNEYGADEGGWGFTREEVSRFMASGETTLRA